MIVVVGFNHPVQILVANDDDEETAGKSLAHDYVVVEGWADRLADSFEGDDNFEDASLIYETSSINMQDGFIMFPYELGYICVPRENISFLWTDMEMGSNEKEKKHKTERAKPVPAAPKGRSKV